MIKKIKVGPYGSIQEPIEFELGSLTLIRGENDAGKSMICYAIMLGLLSRRKSLPECWCWDTSSASTFECWIESQGHDPKYLLSRYRVQEDKAEACFHQDREWFLNEQRRSDAGSIEGIIHSFYLTYGKDPDDGSLGDISEARFFEIAASMLGYHDLSSANGERAVIRTLRDMNSRENRLFKHITVHRGEIIVQEWDKDHTVAFSRIGSSNINAFQVDFALHVAEVYAATKQTLVILDGHPNMFYAGECLPMYHRFMDRIQAALSDNLQVLMTTAQPDKHDIIHADATINLVDPNEATKGTEVESLEFSVASTVNLGDVPSPDAASEVDAEDDTYSMRHIGASWMINFLGEEFTVPDTLGAKYVAHMLEHPGVVFDASQLKNLILPSELDHKNTSDSTTEAEGAIEASSDQNVRKLREQRRTLEGDQEKESNPIFLAEINEDIDKIDAELRRVLSKSGRIRREGGTKDKDRKSTSNAVNQRFYKAVKGSNPSLSAT